MDALRATYGDSSDYDSDFSSLPAPPAKTELESTLSSPLPPPPISLLDNLNSIGAQDFSQTGQPSRVRSFPNIEGSYALYVYIPVHIPSSSKKEMGQCLKKIAPLVPDLHIVNVDIPLNSLCKDEQKLEDVALGRKFHISLARTVPIRAHQIDSIITMLRQKLQFHKRYWIDFNKWEVFVNDEGTRSFISVEVVTVGKAEITKQIQAVNEAYKLHNLPEFYKDPRPHISLAWAAGDISDSMRRALEEVKNSSFRYSIQNRVFTCRFNGIDCRIGNKTCKICKTPDE